MAKKSGLGKGLDALFVDNSTGQGSGAVTLRLSEIEPNKNQPRKDFDENALAQLADSIAEHGVLQPLLVRPLASGGYQLVAGERRWRASKMAGLSEVPVVIQEMTDSEMMELALIENLQREDLNPIEEALGYRELMEKHGMTQDMVAKRVGRSRPAVANALRLLNLPEEVTGLVRGGELTPGAARALLALEDEAELTELAKKAAKGLITVRELEQRAKKPEKSAAKAKAPARRESYYDEMELALREALGRKVKISFGGGKGTLALEFYDKDDLKALADRLAEEHR